MCYHMSIMIQVEVVVHSGIKSRVAGEGEGVVAADEAGEPGVLPPVSPFLVPPKWAILVILVILGVPKMALRVPESKF